MECMTDYVVKCVACNGISYEVESEEGYSLYECSVCKVTWEVIECGKRPI